jgi:hypothetical protein
MTSLSELLNGNSVWAQVLIRYGIVGAIAGYLVYILGSQFITGQTAINKSLADGQILIQHELEFHEIEQKFYLHAICINVARDETARALCETK